MKKKRIQKKIKKQKPTLPGKMFFLVIGFLVALIVFGYRGYILQLFQNNLSAPTTNGIVYHGILPCADCSGLETVLVLSLSSSNSNVGTYTIKQTYQGKNVAPLIQTGVWSVGSKNFSGKSLPVYRLVEDKTENVMYYLQLDDSHLQMLDSEQNVIDTPFNSTLTKE